MSDLLSVSEQILEEPGSSEVLVEHTVLIEGTEVPFLDAYFSGDVAGSTVGVGAIEGRYETTHAATGDPGNDDYFGPVAEITAEDFFKNRQRLEAVKIVFTWSETSSFMWFEPITPSDLGEFEEALGTDFFGSPAALDDPDDFFLDAPIGVVWLTWGDTEYSFAEIDQNGLVTMEDFD